MIELVALVVVVGLGVASIEYDNWFGGFVSFIAVGAAAQWWFQVPVWATILANPILAVGALVAYVIVGLVYATMIRFPRWISACEPRIQSAWADYVRRNPDDHSEEAFRESYSFRDFTAAHNSDRLASWAALWPWGVAWDLVNRPVRWVYRSAYRAFSGILESVERRAIARAVVKKGP